MGNTKNETYSFEVKDLLAAFIDAMGDIVIRRYDENRTITDKVRVPVVYAPKQRVLWDLINKAKTITLPIMAVYQGGMVRDVERVFNKLDGSYYDVDIVGSDVVERLPQPVPVDLTINVSVISRYQADLDQIITNWAPYYDPYIIIEWREPAHGRKIKSPVYWSGNVNFTYPTDVAAEQAYRITADTSFTIKGWLFKAQPKGVQKIYTIDSTYTSLKELPLSWYDVRTDPASAYVTDFWTISARPSVLFVNPLATTTEAPSTSFSLYGDMFTYTVGVFVSGSPFATGLSSLNYFSTNERLSARYPAFSAIPVEWEVQNNSLLTFVAPSAANGGYFDVIVLSEGGYSSLIKDTNSILLENPYPIGSGDWSNYISPVSLAASGVKVIALSS